LDVARDIPSSVVASSVAEVAPVESSQAAIEVHQLRRHFVVSRKAPGLRGALADLFHPKRETLEALGGVDFKVSPGEMLGYIGVNGAGKSTTIKLLTGILAPTAGTVRVLGRDPHRERVENARRIGVVFGQRSQLWWDLALSESLRLVARLYDVPPRRAQELLRRFSQTLELDELLAQPVRTLSLGQKMRAELAAALLHEPDVLYLDEPTIGLDVVVKDRLRAFVKEQNQTLGTTVVLTTHDLGDIEELCPRVILIDRGRVQYDGQLDALKERFGRQRELTFELARPAPAHLELPPGVTVASQAERHLTLHFDRARLTAPEVTAALMPQLDVRDFKLRETDLTAIVKQIAAGGVL
jgi:ABC-2 type transport system ATP-binding protein